MWFQNRRSKEKRDASYREALKDEPQIQDGVSASSIPPGATGKGYELRQGYCLIFGTHIFSPKQSYFSQ